MIKDTSLLEGLGKMEFLKYKCIFDYWHPENLTSMDVGGSNQDVHKKDLPFLIAKINEEKQQKKTERRWLHALGYLSCSEHKPHSPG